VIASPRRAWAWFLWEFLERWPNARNWILYLRGRRVRPIFVDYAPEPTPRYGHGKPAHPRLESLIRAQRGTYEACLRRFLPFADALCRIPRRAGASPADPTWENGMLPALDAASIYCLLGALRPARYFEVGSGHSTRFARRAIADCGLATRITSVDPAPLTEVDALCDEVIRARLEDVDPARFRELEAGDVMFVDGSHRCLPNSDVTAVFLDILPYLNEGVVVGFHDINLPWDYPADAARRAYSEQYVLAAHLLAARRTTIVLASLFASLDPQLAQVLAPLWRRLGLEAAQTHGSSFWMLSERREGEAGAGVASRRVLERLLGPAATG